MMMMNYHLVLLFIVSICKLHVCNSFLGYKWSRYSFSNPIFKLEASNNAAFKHVEKISKDALINPKILTDKPRELYVKRSLAPDQRLSFESFRLGQKCTGKIISIVNHGFFVDIGTIKDGLVHIKDMSNKFVGKNMLSYQYQPGDDITVWIKYINHEQRNLGLQMFPPDNLGFTHLLGDLPVNITLPEASYPWQSLSVGLEVYGRAIKASKFGMYVDFQGPVTGFIHRHKILSNRKQRKLAADELIPLYSVSKFYIYKIDFMKKRIELTNYPPERWEKVFSHEIYDYSTLLRDEEEEKFMAKYQQPESDEEELQLIEELQQKALPPHKRKKLANSQELHDAIFGYRDKKNNEPKSIEWPEDENDQNDQDEEDELVDIDAEEEDENVDNDNDDDEYSEERERQAIERIKTMSFDDDDEDGKGGKIIEEKDITNVKNVWEGLERKNKDHQKHTNDEDDDEDEAEDDLEQSDDEALAEKELLDSIKDYEYDDDSKSSNTNIRRRRNYKQTKDDEIDPYWQKQLLVDKFLRMKQSTSNASYEISELKQFIANGMLDKKKKPFLDDLQDDDATGGGEDDADMQQFTEEEERLFPFTTALKKAGLPPPKDVLSILHQRPMSNQGQQREPIHTDEELFNRLSRNRAEIRFPQLKKWYFIQECIDLQLITMEQVKLLFIQAGAKYGKLTEMQFQIFQKLLFGAIRYGGSIPIPKSLQDDQNNSNSYVSGLDITLPILLGTYEEEEPPQQKETKAEAAEAAEASTPLLYHHLEDTMTTDNVGGGDSDNNESKVMMPVKKSRLLAIAKKVSIDMKEEEEEETVTAAAVEEQSIPIISIKQQEKKPKKEQPPPLNSVTLVAEENKASLKEFFMESIGSKTNKMYLTSDRLMSQWNSLYPKIIALIPSHILPKPMINDPPLIGIELREVLMLFQKVMKNRKFMYFPQFLGFSKQVLQLFVDKNAPESSLQRANYMDALSGMQSWLSKSKGDKTPPPPPPPSTSSIAVHHDDNSNDDDEDVNSQIEMNLEGLKLLEGQDHHIADDHHRVIENESEDDGTTILLDDFTDETTSNDAASKSLLSIVADDDDIDQNNDNDAIPTQSTTSDSESNTAIVDTPECAVESSVTDFEEVSIMRSAENAIGSADHLLQAEEMVNSCLKDGEESDTTTNSQSLININVEAATDGDTVISTEERLSSQEEEETDNIISPSISEDPKEIMASIVANTFNSLALQVDDIPIVGDDNSDDTPSPSVNTTTTISSTVSFDQLLGWNYVFDLIGEGIITEESLADMISQIIATDHPKEKRKHLELNLSQFQTLFEQLIQVEKEANKQSENLDPFRRLREEEEEMEDDDDEEGEEEYELDSKVTYTALAKGRTYIPVEELRSWDFVQRLIEERLLSKKDVNRTIASILSVHKGKFQYEEFDLFLKEILLLSGLALPDEEISDKES